MPKTGFTLIETVIALAIISLITLSLLTLFNPIENIRKSQDAATYVAAKNIISAILRFNTSDDKSPLSSDLIASPISDTSSESMLTKLIETQELKQSFLPYSKTKIAPLYFTITKDLKKLKVCYVPTSKHYKSHPSTLYDASGEPTNCTNNACHLCLDSSQIITSSPLPSSTPIQTPSCDPFNPAYPNYAFTCNSLSTWSQYGCDHFCVADLGCQDSYCPPGSRHLRKTFTGTGVTNFLSCIVHTSETNEDYCVSDTYANCQSIPYSSSTSDYVWGCTNPVRPYTWK